MDITKNVEKLDKYYKRLKTGKAEKIKQSHVEKVIRKLTAKRDELGEEMAEAGKPDKKDRIAGKIRTVDEQIARAQWLLDKIDPD